MVDDIKLQSSLGFEKTMTVTIDGEIEEMKELDKRTV
jgi:hypothetical protein